MFTEVNTCNERRSGFHQAGKTHKELFQQFMLYFGSSESEVIRNLALRWIESNITNPNIEDLARRGLLQLKVEK